MVGFDNTISNKNSALLIAILFWCGLVILISMYMTISLGDFFADTFNKTPTEAAWVGSSFSICYAVGCLIYGPFSDKYGRKIFLVTSISVLTVITFVIGFVNDFYVLVIFRAIQGIVAAAFAPISLVYAGEILPPHKRLTAVGFIISGLLMAGIVGQVFSGVVNEHLGWHAIFYILGLLYLLTTLLVVFCLPKEEFQPSADSVWMKFKQMTALFKNKQLLLTYSITFMLLLSLVGMYTVLGSYLSSPRFGLTNQDILYIRAIGIIGMLFSPFAGIFAMKFGELTVLRFGLICSAFGLFVIVFSPVLSLTIVMSIIFVTGICLVAPVIISIISQIARNVQGSAVSFNAFILFLGASIGPLVAALFLKYEQYILSFFVLGAILLGGLMLSFFIKMEPSEIPKKIASEQTL